MLGASREIFTDPTPLVSPKVKEIEAYGWKKQPKLRFISSRPGACTCISENKIIGF
jgi:hypothetical protein